jgi:predicted RNA-binding Zn ribbon-like protein
MGWLDVAGLVPRDVLARMRRTALPGELDAVAAQARALREWFRGFVTKHKGRRLSPEALKELAPLNRLLERDQGYAQIVKSGRSQGSERPGGLECLIVRRLQDPESLIFPIARSMVELLCGEDFSHIKACEGASCTLVFMDRTHRRAKRWCSMAVCGNRAKQAAHRRRNR